MIFKNLTHQSHTTAKSASPESSLEPRPTARAAPGSCFPLDGRLEHLLKSNRCGEICLRFGNALELGRKKNTTNQKWVLMNQHLESSVPTGIICKAAVCGGTRVLQLGGGGCWEPEAVALHHLSHQRWLSKIPATGSPPPGRQRGLGFALQRSASWRDVSITRWR